MLSVLPEDGPSVPSPTATPAARSWATGVTPLPALVLLPMQCATRTPRRAISVMSSGVRWMQCAASRCVSAAPMLSKNRIGVMPMSAKCFIS